MNSEIRDRYSAIYEEMKVRNRLTIEVTGIRHDPFLQYDLPDTRHGLSIISFFENFDPQEFDGMFREAQQKFDGHVLYGTTEPQTYLSARLHMTFLQLFRINAENAAVLPEPFVGVVQDVVSQIGPFDVSFEGLIATPGNILMYGYPRKLLFVSYQ